MENPGNSPYLHDAIKFFCCGVLAMLGGIVREIKSEKEMTLMRFVGGAFIGMFCGVVVFCVMRHWGADDWLTAAATALGGYMGTPALDLLKKQFTSKLDK